MLQYRTPVYILSLFDLSKRFQTQESYLNSSLMACSMALGLVSSQDYVSQCLKNKSSSSPSSSYSSFSLYILFPLFFHLYTERVKWTVRGKNLGCLMSILFTFLNIHILTSFYPSKYFWLCEYTWNLGATISFCLKCNVFYSPWLPLLFLERILVTISACFPALTLADSFRGHLTAGSLELPGSESGLFWLSER